MKRPSPVRPEPVEGCVPQAMACFVEVCFDKLSTNGNVFYAPTISFSGTLASASSAGSTTARPVTSARPWT